jgi:imidazolonepropionase-like amidohydrolase
VIWNHGNQKDPGRGPQFDAVAKIFVPGRRLIASDEGRTRADDGNVRPWRLFAVYTLRSAERLARRVRNVRCMLQTGSFRRAALGLAFLCCAAIAQSGAQTQQGTGRLALIGGTIYTDPTSEPIRDGVVLVQDGKIAGVGNRRSLRIPADAQTVDCSGLAVVAGYWNSHVHFLQRKWADAGTIAAPELARQLQTMLTQYGFTSVFDTWSAWENTRRIRDRIVSGEVAGPRIRSSGEAMFGKGEAVPPAAWGSLGFIPLERFQMATVASEEDALTASKALLDRGVDALKFYAATPGAGTRVVPEAAMAAGVTEGHRRGKPVFSHPSTAQALLASVRAGVDVIAHTTPQSGPWETTTVAAMKAANVALIPTLKLWTYELRHERASWQDRFVDTAVGQLHAWNAAGGVVLFGTDVGYMSEYDTADEFVLMSRAGMTVGQILASLTTSPAERFGASKELGRVATGMLADLTVLRGDPLSDARAFATVAFTIRDGRVIYRDSR